MRKGTDMTLDKAINICRTEEITKMQMKEIKNDKEICGIRTKSYKNNRFTNSQGGTDQKKRGDEQSKWNQTIVGKKCRFCGKIHKPRECPAYGKECYKCHKKNHWASCCMSKSIHETTTKDEKEYDYVIEAVETDDKASKTEAFVVIEINKKKVRVKLDTGAEVNVMPIRVFQQIQNNIKLEKTPTRLCAYDGASIPLEGKIKALCEFNVIKEICYFYVVKLTVKQHLVYKHAKHWS